MTAKKVVFGVVLCLAVVTGWILQAGLGIERTLMSGGFYRAVIEEAGGENLQDYFLEAAPEKLKSYALWDESMIYRALVRTADEGWLKEQAAHAAGEYIRFIRGDQEMLVVKIDLAGRRAVFLEELERELDKHYPVVLEELGPDFLDRLLSRVDIPSEITLIEVQDLEELRPEFKAELESLNRTRTYMRYSPWICFVMLAVVGFLWLRSGWTLVALGLGCLLSGVTGFVLWPYGWEATVVPFVNRLVAGHGLLELIWGREGEMIFGLAGEVIERITLFMSSAGAGVLLFGLVVVGGSWLINKQKPGKGRQGKSATP